MSDAENDSLPIAEGEESPNAPSDGGELQADPEARRSSVRKTEALLASDEQDDTEAPVDEKGGRGDAAEGERGAPLQSENGDEPGAEEEALAELVKADEEEIVRQSIALARHEEQVDHDEPDLTALDAPALRGLILQMRTDHNQQLQAEERARAEVEDMCLRIEKHFKAEKARPPILLHVRF